MTVTPLMKRYLLDHLLMNRVHHMEATELLGLLPDKSIDLIVTSPPYDNLRTYNGYSFDFETIAQESYRVLKDGGVLVWVAGDATVNGSETLTSFRQALFFKDAIGFKSWDTMIWQKVTPGKFHKRYAPAWEFMFVYCKGGEPQTFNAQLKRNLRAGHTSGGGHSTKDGHKRDYQQRVIPEWGVMENIWNIATGHNATEHTGHPAPFPEELAERHILTWSNPGDTVLDYFGGSGTTAKMTRNTKRNYIYGDMSLDYVLIARDRLRLPFERRHTVANNDVSALPLFATGAA